MEIRFPDYNLETAGGRLFSLTRERHTEMLNEDGPFREFWGATWCHYLTTVAGLMRAYGFDAAAHQDTRVPMLKVRTDRELTVMPVADGSVKARWSNDRSNWSTLVASGQLMYVPHRGEIRSDSRDPIEMLVTAILDHL